MVRVSRGALVEYAVSLPPLVLMFEFNPEQISRSRTITVRTGNAPGTRGGYDFVLPTETPRVAQGVTVQPETLTIDVLFDATDRMNQGDPIASVQGVQPELDTLRAMVEPDGDGVAPVRAAVDLLSDALLSHLSYEERELVEPLARLGFY